MVAEWQEDGITNGVIDDGSTPADVCMVYAKTGQDDDGGQQITTFIVGGGWRGIRSAKDTGQTRDEGLQHGRAGV